jgi:hypothetical protein
MLIPACGLVGGFVLWVFVRKRLSCKVGRRATVVFFACLLVGLAVGLWADSDTIRTIYNALHRGPVPGY